MALAAILAAWSAGAPWLGAGEAPAGAPPLTLSEALALAERRNEQPAIAAARVRQAQATLRQARGLLKPSVTVTGNYDVREQEQSFDGRAADSQELSAALIVDQPLFDAATRPLLAAARANARAIGHESLELRRDLAFAVAETFYALLSSERLRAAAERRVAVAEDAAAEARARVGAGLTGANDATRSDLELATAKLGLITAANLERSTRLGLELLIAGPVDRPLASEPFLVADRVPETGRSDLAALDERAAAARLFEAEPRRAWVPTLALRGRGEVSDRAYQDGDHTDWTASLLLTWRLYDGGRRYGLLEQREAETRQAELIATSERRRLTNQATVAEVDVDTAVAGLAEAEARKRLADVNAEEIRSRFGRGLASALEQADAIASAFEADAALARQQFALSLAHLRLAQALGRWPQGTPP